MFSLPYSVWFLRQIHRTPKGHSVQDWYERLMGAERAMLLLQKQENLF